jgi:hypothetical protein
MQRVSVAVRRLCDTPARARFAARRPELATLITQVRAEKLTYLSWDNLRELAETVLEISDLPGAIIEAGTALGGSAIVLAAAKSPSRPMKVYDAFGMIPPPSDRDGADVQARYQSIVAGASRGIGDDEYYGYHDDLLAEVTANFARFRVPTEQNDVELVRGYYEDTLRDRVAFPVALAHIDCDWYDSVMTCLEAVAPSLLVGGRIVLDDYHTWSGCTAAVDEFFARDENVGRFEWVKLRPKPHIRRVG